MGVVQWKGRKIHLPTKSYKRLGAPSAKTAGREGGYIVLTLTRGRFLPALTGWYLHYLQSHRESTYQRGYSVPT